MFLEQKVTDVMERLVAIRPNLKGEDYEQVAESVEGLLEDGLSLNQAVRFALCYEEVTPDLAEGEALARMNAILDEGPENQA